MRRTVRRADRPEGVFQKGEEFLHAVAELQAQVDKAALAQIAEAKRVKAEEDVRCLICVDRPKNCV